MHAVTERGTLERLPVAELLQHVADTKKSAEVVLHSSAGQARLWFRVGHLIDAQIGELNGEAAVTELLDVKEGAYAIEYKAVHGLPAINESIASLIGRRKRRAAEWQRLVGELGGLETVLSVRIRGMAAARKALTKADFVLLETIDGRRTIIDVVYLSGLDPVAVLERLVWYAEAGLVRPRGSPSAPPPAPAAIEPVAVQSSEGSLARPMPKPRRGTLIGVVTPEPPAETAAAPAHVSIVPAPIIPLKTAAHSALVDSRTSGTLVGFAPPPGESASPAAPSSPPPSPPPPPFTSTATSVAESPDWPAPEQPPDAAAPVERPSEAPVLPVRALLGRYEVLCRIARGGMGSVYLCRVTGEGGFRRLFALKALRERLTRDPAATRMFLQEARIAAKIYDPHVVGIVDVGIQASQPYLVMDYVEGGSLQQLLRRHPRYRPPRLIVPLLLDALAGLHAAHTLADDDGAPLELVHCDVSPHNMLVGVDGTCRLSDFGIAKAAAAAGGVTGSHGKPGYLSPEQAAGRNVDRRADLFSLGVVMWNALTGERLFSGRSVDETLGEVLHKEIPRPSTLGLKPPACLDAICMKALARDPAARYQTAEEMLRALRTVALREDLLASSSDVARWVTSTFGEELQARRLAVLDASRRVKAAGASESDVLEAERSSHTDGLRHFRRPSSVPPEAPTDGEPRGADLRGRESVDALDEPPLPSGPLSSAPASSARSQTIVLPRKNDRKNRVVLGAAILSVLVVILALVWPNQLAKLFRLEMAAPRATPSTFEPKLPSLQPPSHGPREVSPGAPAAAKAAENARFQVP
jgi:serine/threonine-protein kinase